MTSTTVTSARPYHHGDLRNALVEAGVELAREGGPDAIVLREAARRVGVSPNAAYRHFDDLPDLVHAVAQCALVELGQAMRRRTAKVRRSGDDAVDAWRVMHAAGRGYVEFALTECGLFRTAFDRRAREGRETAVPPDCSPQELLAECLHRLVNAGLLPAQEREPARMLAWSTVHGLALLLLGPCSELPARERDVLIDATLDQVGKGLLPAGVPQRRGGGSRKAG